MVQTILRELRDAAADGNRARVVELADQMLDAFERGRARESALENVARSVRSNARADDADAAATAQSVLNAAAEANQAKINVDTAVLDYVGGGDGTDLVDVLDAAIETHDAFDERVKRLRAETTDLELPPAVGVTAPDQIVVPKGRAVDGAITVRNDGTAAAREVTLDLDADATVDLAATSVERIAAGETTSVELVGTPTSAGVSRPSVTANVDDGADSASFYLHVQNKRTFLEQAVDDIVQLYSEIAGAGAALEHGRGSGKSNGKNTNSGKGNGKNSSNGKSGVVPPGLENKLRQITERTIEIIGRIERGADERSVDNQIRSVTNQIGALSNQLEATAGKKLRAADAPRLQRDIESIVEVYESARKAQA